ncbi:TIGR03915 family putative DNA repair protein [Anaerosphaera multitolerans]|uniref:DNA metabolism protein n=1 Tax=Anaerosphaera multitolerans TaxID=2487351 RepID=A0A437S5K5_9FIRM|nr:TIGR03915 family putative DNA repair protein [Anaerosphaera multitolerans]RVU54257.1 DNA metabolism protein [Anaerosphaera multitolerans]
MIYLYDGTFEGLLTLAFESYKDIENISVVKDDGQLDFFQNKVEVRTDSNKYERVKNSIIKRFSYSFFLQMYLCYLSEHIKKEEIILKTLKSMYLEGSTFLNSSSKNSVLFNKISKKVSSEAHFYKGLLRFKEIQEGFLFAEFEPENNILEILTNHFIKRMAREKFIICDVGRRRCSIYFKGKCNYYDVLDLKVFESFDEEFFSEAWKLFYKTVKIKERENHRLMKSNMPKKYWKYLTEKN